MGKIEEDKGSEKVAVEKRLCLKTAVFSLASHLLLNLSFFTCEMEIMIMTYRTINKIM